MNLFRLAATLSALATLAAAQPDARPNIIFILADDLGYGEVGFNGQTRYATPNIDRIAREGLVFTDHYSGSTICAPSRNSLMTGHHTGHATIRNNFVGGGNDGGRVALKPTDITVAERLRAAGYTTAMIGKWGLGEPDTTAAPWRKGWDFFYGFVNQAHAHNQYPEFLYRDSVAEPLDQNFSHKERVYANDLFTTEAEAFLARVGAAPAMGSPRKPFFLYFSATTPHADLKCPADSITEVKQAYAWAREPGADESSVVFAAMMHRLDRDVGRLLAKLKALGLEENTLVIFTSDNGAHEEDGKDNAFFRTARPFRGIKRDLYEGGIRVPFAARWAGRIAAGTRTSHLSAFWDFSATALELAGLPRPADLPTESISYAPTLLGRTIDQITHSHLYWEISIKGQARQAVREGKWKLIRNGLTTAPELYDLAEDPAESSNLAAREPKVTARLIPLLTASRIDTPDFPLTPGGTDKIKGKTKK
ncbi:MAG: arylsulfatase [Opitutaceae bacterium]